MTYKPGDEQRLLEAAKTWDVRDFKVTAHLASGVCERVAELEQLRQLVATLTPGPAYPTYVDSVIKLARHLARPGAERQTP